MRTLNQPLKESLMGRDRTAVFREYELPDIQGAFEILIVETTLQSSVQSQGHEIEDNWQAATWLVSFNPNGPLYTSPRLLQNCSGHTYSQLPVMSIFINSAK